MPWTGLVRVNGDSGLGAEKAGWGSMTRRRSGLVAVWSCGAVGGVGDYDGFGSDRRGTGVRW